MAVMIDCNGVCCESLNLRHHLPTHWECASVLFIVMAYRCGTFQGSRWTLRVR